MEASTRRKWLLSMTLALFVIWFVIPALYRPAARPIYILTLPARLLGVFVHEMGHGFGALLSGGRFIWFQMDLNGGVSITEGGVRLIVLLCGLLGPAMFGMIMLRVSTHPRYLRFGQYALMLFFFSGIYYMLKPLWVIGLGRAGGWTPLHLLMTPFPLAVLLVLYKSLKAPLGRQLLIFQLLVLLVCFSAFSSTGYIFMYEVLPNGLRSDTYQVANLFWAGQEPPRWFFNLFAWGIAGVNLGLLVIGLLRAVKPTRGEAKQDS